MPPAADTPAMPLVYAPVTRRGRVWRHVRPGTPLFFLLVLALTAGGMWGGWRWRLRADRTEFEACAEVWPAGRGERGVTFIHPPTRGAMRHLSRMPAMSHIGVHDADSADAIVKELARPDSGLKALAMLDLSGPQVTDASVKELARPDGGLAALTSLYLYGTSVTEAGLRELARSDSGLKSLASLDLYNTPVTDAGMKELARPGGLTALTTLNLQNTQATDAGVAALQTARPGLMIYH